MDEGWSLAEAQSRRVLLIHVLIKGSALIRCCRRHAIRETVSLKSLLTLLTENLAAQIDIACVSLEYYAAPLCLVWLLALAALWIALLVGELFIVWGIKTPR